MMWRFVRTPKGNRIFRAIRHAAGVWRTRRREIDLVAMAKPDACPTRETEIAAAFTELRGWWRIKIAGSHRRFREFELTALDGGGQVVGAFRVAEPSKRLRCFIHVGGRVRSVRVQFALNVGEERIEAGLRPVPLREFLWRSIRHGLFRHPPTFLAYFFAPLESFLVSDDFPAPPAFRSDNTDYRRWIARRESRAIGERPAALSVSRPELPEIAVLLTVCDPEPDDLRRAIDSVLRQTANTWRLCIADDASSNAEVRAIVEQAARLPQASAALRPRREGISAATNTAFALADAPFVACLDHDDMLAPRAIELCGKALAAGDCDLVYSDEDKIDAFDNRFSPFFKPDYSPELLRSYNYFNHLTVHRSETIRTIGGWRSAFDGAQDYDVVLRSLDVVDPGRIRHLPHVLYHWRVIAGSTASDIGAKHYAVEAGRKALEAHLARRNVRARVALVPGIGYRVIHAAPEPRPKVSIIVPFRDRDDLLRRCCSSLFGRTTYPDWELLLVDNGSREKETIELLASYRKLDRVRVISAPGPFNYSALNNRAAREASGDYLCFLNNDIEVITPEWLDDMVGYASQEGVGCVGAKLYYQNGTIQHAGLVLGVGGIAAHAFPGWSRSANGYFGRLKIASNYSAVTGACLLVKRSVFASVGGFDEADLTVAYNDVDLCLRVQKQGYRNVFTPFAELYHLESASRGSDRTPEKNERVRREIDVMRRKHGALIDNDPCYSPNLSRRANDFSIESE